MKVEMISWILFFMGIFLFVIGAVIWHGQKLDLVHGDDACKVKPENTAPYSRLLGIGLFCIAAGIDAYAVLSCFESIPQWSPYIGAFCGLFSGATIIFIGHKKYFDGEY